MSVGSIGILNVGTGDTKLVFDKNNPAECIRAARIVKDMLRRGYALLVEVEDEHGAKRYQRVHEFKDDTCEYIIADFDPITAEREDQAEQSHVDEVKTQERPQEDRATPAPKRRGRKKKAIPATDAKAIAVARSAGG